MQQGNSITYQGTTHSFQCSEESWNLYKDIIKAWCNGKDIEYVYDHNVVETVGDLNAHYDHLYYCRIKPKEYSKNYPKVGEVWKDPLVDSCFVICKDTDKTGQVFWIDESKISSSGFTYKNIVFDNHCEKVYDSMEDYFKANEDK